MPISRKAAWMLLMAALAIVAPSVVLAADMKIGVVDTTKLMEAPRIKQYDEELTRFVQSLKDKLAIRNQTLMLNEDEIKELIDLKIKAKATDADKARIKTLEDTEKARDAELKSLQETKETTDQQKARLKELQDMRQKAKDTGAALEKDYNGQVQSKMQELDAKVATEVQDAITRVAEAEKLTLVFTKTAVFYGGTDITDKVIEKLDRKIN